MSQSLDDLGAHIAASMTSAITGQAIAAGELTLTAKADQIHPVLMFLRDDPRCDYNFLSDVIGVDYLNYPTKTLGRFAVIYNLISHARDCRFWPRAR